MPYYVDQFGTTVSQNDPNMALADLYQLARELQLMESMSDRGFGSNWGMVRTPTGYTPQNPIAPTPQVTINPGGADSDGGGFLGMGDMLSGSLLHGGNILENYWNNPEQLLTAGAFGPAGSSLESSLWGGDTSASNALGQPSQETYQEMANEGINVQSNQFLHDIGLMVGGAAAGAGLSNAMGLGAGPASSGLGEVGAGGAMDMGVGLEPVAGGFGVGPEAMSAAAGPSSVPVNTSVQAGANPWGEITPTSGGFTPTGAETITSGTPWIPESTAGITGGNIAGTTGSAGISGGGAAAMGGATGGLTGQILSQTGGGAAAQQVLDQGGGDNPYGDTSWPDDSSVDPTNPYGNTSWPDDSSVPTGGQGMGSFDWNSIPEGLRSAIQSALAPTGQGGMNWLGLGTDLMGLSGQRDYQQGLLQAMNRSIDYSDSAHAQRPQYQQMYQNMNTNPNWMNDDAVLQGMQNNAMRNVSAQNTAKGYLNSGNILHDLTRTGVETAGNYALPRMQQVGQASGLLMQPNNANIGGLAQAAGQAGLAQTQTLQGMAGRIPSGIQNGINSGINTGLSNLFNQFLG